MTDFNKCNGWTNYPTWTINLFYGTSFQLADFCNLEEAAERIACGDRSGFLYDLAQNLENWFEDYFAECHGDDIFNNCLGQLFRYAWEQIDWYELAESWLESAEEEPEFRNMIYCKQCEEVGRDAES